MYELIALGCVLSAFLGVIVYLAGLDSPTRTRSFLGGLMLVGGLIGAIASAVLSANQHEAGGRLRIHAEEIDEGVHVVTVQRVQDLPDDSTETEVICFQVLLNGREARELLGKFLAERRGATVSVFETNGGVPITLLVIDPPEQEQRPEVE